MIYAIDVDGVIALTQGNDYPNSKPVLGVIAKVNELYDKGHKIIIFTARGSTSGIDWRELTERQLKKWGVKYRELLFNKPSFDYIVDDRALNLKEFMALEV